MIVQGMEKDKLKLIKQLLGCYFHQDWMAEFDSGEDAFRAISVSEPKEMILDCVAEIDNILVAQLSEGELRILLAETLGCYFDPGSEQLTCQQWLMQVRKKLAQV
ncbi:contact-dependent growth inhibition system immunity protein [Ralstonia pseudosolanacearum]